MKTLLATVAAGLAAVALAAAAQAAPAVQAARAADPDECTGLQVCVPVKGPWVKLPAPAAGAGSAVAVEWELACPTKNYIVGGTDARATVAGVDVTFEAAIGSPVGAGKTTGNSAVFRATYGGSDAVATAFRPALGCVPTQGGGGGRSLVRYAAPVIPALPLDRHVEEHLLVRGSVATTTVSCKPGARLLRHSAAIGFDQAAPPTAAMLRAVSVTTKVKGASVTVVARTTSALLPLMKAKLQVRTVCTEGFQ